MCAWLAARDKRTFSTGFLTATKVVAIGSSISRTNKSREVMGLSRIEFEQDELEYYINFWTREKYFKNGIYKIVLCASRNGVILL